MSKPKDPAREIRAQTEKVVKIGLERLESILTDPETSNADVFKGVALLFERIYHPEHQDNPLGDFEIHLKA